MRFPDAPKTRAARSARRGWSIACGLLAAACGDNRMPIGPLLEHADTMFVVAHPDDDLIFMQPELWDALHAGSVTSVYLATGDVVRGFDHTQRLFGATRTAYAAALGVTSWDCGLVAIAGASVQHCRAHERPVSLIKVDLPDGGIPGDRAESLLHLVDGSVASLRLLGPNGGSVNVATAIDLVAELVAVTAPGVIHTLELAGTHGRDHSSHLFAASFALWAAARIGYAGELAWHRGYNVADEPTTLTAAEYGVVAPMLGHYEACADGCAPCGTPCAPLDLTHDIWLQRQYASARVLGAAGRLRIADRCLTGTLELGDCATTAVLRLDRTGHLKAGEHCLTSTPSSGVALAACSPDPAQYWVLDGEGFVWNGAPPEPSGEMAYDHVRCLGEHGAPTCGSRLRPQWRFE